MIRLRYKEPDRDRPYRMPLNVPFRGGSLPIPAVLCVLMSAIAFVALMVEHGSARWVGVLWMVAGVSLYVGYRTSQGKSVLRRVTVPESALTRRAAEAEFGSMLVPVLGTPLDDDIMQTAGRLAAEENADDGEGGAMIEALWIFEVPMALPLDTRDPRRRAQARPGRAEAGEGRGGGVRGRRGRHRGRARPQGRPGDRARGASGAAWRRSCWPRRSRPAWAAACGWAASRACTTRAWGRRPATSSTRPTAA